MPVSEVITDGVEGLLVPMDSPYLLSQRVISLLSSPELRLSLSRAAQLKARSYDQSITLPKLANLIESLPS